MKFAVNRGASKTYGGKTETGSRNKDVGKTETRRGGVGGRGKGGVKRDAPQKKRGELIQLLQWWREGCWMLREGNVVATMGVYLMEREGGGGGRRVGGGGARKGATGMATRA